ncbi:6710_t:CDS:1 [Dentiscutata erythropus]|uniref:6710_t:CDS:1 n=1 Tax=Dentiscutata erythropus TaxID=1348616 RepID=A0A9N9D875_9GLOM|nr:6710_t:CDS:1 [Dentiscutata erythropus]
MLEKVESGKNVKDLKMDILREIHYIIKAWNKVKERTIYNCWHYTNILSNNNDEIFSEDSQEIKETDEMLNLSNSIENLNLPNSMEVVDFLAIHEEEIFCEILDKNSMIAEIIEIFKERPEESDDEDSDKADDSVETAIISTNETLKSLEVMRIFLL